MWVFMKNWFSLSGNELLIYEAMQATNFIVVAMFAMPPSFDKCISFNVFSAIYIIHETALI